MFIRYGFVHTPRRNRLTVKRAGNICYIAHNYRLLNDEPKKQKLLESGSLDEAELEVDDDDVAEEVYDDEMFLHHSEDTDDELDQLLIENGNDFDQ